MTYELSAWCEPSRVVDVFDGRVFVDDIGC